jgi:integrase
MRCSNGTINRHLSAVSKMARVAWKGRQIDQMPELPWQKEGAGRLRTYTKEEVGGIINLARRWGYEREADLFQFLIDTGGRLGEVAKARWKDFGKDFASVTFHGDTTKTDQTRTIPLFPTSREALARRWMASAGERGPFTGMNSARTRKPGTASARRCAWAMTPRCTPSATPARRGLPRTATTSGASRNGWAMLP